MYWSRDDTKEWIVQLENRIEDIDYYLNRTVEWCETNGVWDNEKVYDMTYIKDEDYLRKGFYIE